MNWATCWKKNLILWTVSLSGWRRILRRGSRISPISLQERTSSRSPTELQPRREWCFPPPVVFMRCLSSAMIRLESCTMNNVYLSSFTFGFSCHPHKLIRFLCTKVNKTTTKNNAPNTEPCGTPMVQVLVRKGTKKIPVLFLLSKF